MKISGSDLIMAGVGVALVATFAVFATLLFSDSRAGDPNNEDAILAEAEKAQEADDPPRVAECYSRLVALNPFDREYERKLFHALVRVRDWKSLSDLASRFPVEKEFTEKEWEIERTMAKVTELMGAHSNELALATCEIATNLNYFAATPLYIDCAMAQGRLEEALRTARAYIRRFPLQEVLLQTVELCALANRPDLIGEVRTAARKGEGLYSISFAYYCDTLEDWLKQDWEKATSDIANIQSDIDTPLSRIVRLEVAAAGDNPARLRLFYRQARGSFDMLDFGDRARLAVKRFVAAHFPDKLSVDQLRMTADLVLDEYEDLDLLRVKLLTKLVEHHLPQNEIDQAVAKYPNDRGLQLIQQRLAAQQAGQQVR